MFDFVKRVVEEANIPEKFAEALLVHIPKEENPSEDKNFIPISLCNAIIKLATKMIVNRDLEQHYSTKSGIARAWETKNRRHHSVPRACTFIEIYNNHKGGMILKLEREKAYD